MKKLLLIREITWKEVSHVLKIRFLVDVSNIQSAMELKVLFSRNFRLYLEHELFTKKTEKKTDSEITTPVI